MGKMLELPEGRRFASKWKEEAKPSHPSLAVVESLRRSCSKDVRTRPPPLQTLFDDRCIMVEHAFGVAAIKYFTYFA
jgi:hypothetical protein